jgi:hypothetical protein
LQRLSGQSSPRDHVNGSTRDNSANSSVPITPATEELTATPNNELGAQAMVVNVAELLRLKTELQEARNEVDRMNQELHTTHQIKSTFDNAVGQTPETEYYYKGEVSEQTISQLQNKFNASTRQNFGRQEAWPLQDDSLSEKSDTKPFAQGAWNNGGVRQQQYANNGWGTNMSTHGFGPVCEAYSLHTPLYIMHEG